MASHSSSGGLARNRDRLAPRPPRIRSRRSVYPRHRPRLDIDDNGFWSFHQRQRLGDHAGKFRIDQNNFGAAVIELEGDGGRVEPDIERVQHRTGHRDREMHLVHRRDVRQHGRHRVAAADVVACEVGRKAPAARIGLGPGEAAALVDGTGMIGIDGSRSCQKTYRRQRHKIGGRLVQSNAVLILRSTHWSPILFFLPLVSAACGNPITPHQIGSDPIALDRHGPTARAVY